MFICGHKKRPLLGLLFEFSVRESTNGHYRALLGLQKPWLKHVSRSQEEKIFDVAGTPADPASNYPV